MNALLGAARTTRPRCVPSVVQLVPRRCRSAPSRPGPSSHGYFSRFVNIIRQDLKADTPSSTHHDGHGGSRKSYGHADTRRKYSLFSRLIDSRLKIVMDTLGPWHVDHQEYLSLGLNSQADVERQAKLFKQLLRQSLRDSSVKGQLSRTENPLFWSLRNAFIQGDTAGLTREIKYKFQNFILQSRVPHAVTTLQEDITDFRYPYEWYPATRTMQRTVHLHVGPTNSGKTYRALQALEAAKTGIYAGPLRLLAHEIYSRFTAKGKPCALITGEEQRLPEGHGSDSYFQSCTVEMTSLNRRVDVAVIDEIQMMGDPDRGWAWTQAFLGVQARELHLCGEVRTVELVQALCDRIGDKCIVHRYDRLSSLQTMNDSLKGDFGNLRKGDAVVSFSRIGLHTLKAGIEKITGRRCAIVYGSLPPETRAQQAALFNDQDNDYDFLVASDAIGMGLNLEIKRVIFETATKHDGMSFRHLTIPEIKQIGGRAGRFRSAAQAIQKGNPANAEATSPAPPPGVPAFGSGAAGTAAKKWGTPGFVSTMEEEDLGVVQAGFTQDAPPLQYAGIQAPMFAVEQFSQYFPPDTPFSFILQRMREMCRVSGRFQLCMPKDTLEVADAIQSFPMSIQDRCVFISAPSSLRDPGFREVLQAMARCVSELNGGHLLDIPEINLEILDKSKETYPEGPQRYLMALEALHKSITLYLWLSYRYVGVFTSQDLAFHVKSLVEEKITDYLENLTFVPEQQQQRARKLRKLAERRKKTGERIFAEEQEQQQEQQQQQKQQEAGQVETASTEPNPNNKQLADNSVPEEAVTPSSAAA